MRDGREEPKDRSQLRGGELTACAVLLGSKEEEVQKYSYVKLGQTVKGLQQYKRKTSKGRPSAGKHKSGIVGGHFHRRSGPIERNQVLGPPITYEPAANQREHFRTCPDDCHPVEGGRTGEEIAINVFARSLPLIKEGRGTGSPKGKEER